jgi:myo-inositol-1(or 4)-monophosphatase
VSEVADVRALAERLARAAGAIQRDRYETELVVRTKSASIDLVTEVDHACEALIVGALRRDRPSDAVLAEEAAATTGPAPSGAG